MEEESHVGGEWREWRKKWEKVQGSLVDSFPATRLIRISLAVDFCSDVLLKTLTDRTHFIHLPPCYCSCKSRFPAPVS